MIRCKFCNKELGNITCAINHTCEKKVKEYGIREKKYRERKKEK